MNNKKTFFRCWLFVCWMPIVSAVGGGALQALRMVKAPAQYTSAAQLVAGGRTFNLDGGNTINYREYLADFYGTITETLEHSEMRRRARDRVRALHPEFAECGVKIEADREKGAGFINVRATGSEAKYTRTFLDALLDEFVSHRNHIREQQRNKALKTLAEDVSHREKSLRENREKLAEFEERTNADLFRAEHNRLVARLMRLRDERDDSRRKNREVVDSAAVEEATKIEKEIQAIASQLVVHDQLNKDYGEAKRSYDELLDLLRRLTPSDEMMMSEFFTIMERATNPVEKSPEWAQPVLVAGLKGGLAGFLASLLMAALMFMFPSGVHSPRSNRDTEQASA